MLGAVEGWPGYFRIDRRRITRNAACGSRSARPVQPRRKDQQRANQPDGLRHSAGGLTCCDKGPMGEFRPGRFCGVWEGRGGRMTAKGLEA